MARGIGDFLTGLVDGVNTRRQWKREDEQRELAAEDRRIRAEDRARLIKNDEEDRRQRAEDRVALADDRKYRRSILDYDFSRRVEADKREDGQRAAVQKSMADGKAEWETLRKADAEAEARAAANGPDQAGNGSMLRATDPTVAAPAGTAPAALQAANDPLAPLRAKKRRSVMASDPDAAARRKRAGQGFYDWYIQTKGPEIRDSFLAAGDLDKANAFNVWLEEEKVRDGVRDFGRAVHAAQMGDEDGFLDHMAAAYNNEGYYGDGMEVDRSRSGFKKDAAGNVIGGQLTFRNRRTGQLVTQDIGSETDLYRLGLGVMSPEAVFDHAMGQIRAQEAAAAEGAKADAEMERGITRDAAKAQAEAAAKDPNEPMQKRVDKMIETLAASDIGFAKLTPQQQVEKAMQVINAADAAIKGGSALGTVQGGLQPPQVPVWRGN